MFNDNNASETEVSSQSGESTASFLMLISKFESLVHIDNHTDPKIAQDGF